MSKAILSDNLRTPCSIVIRAYNEERFIGRLLDGIRHQETIDPEIILVDSGSTDRTTAIAERYPVKIIHLRPQEFSFGRSLNLGIRAAKHELIAIASAHVYPIYPDWLDRLLSPFIDPRVALSYGRQLGGESSHFSEKEVLARWFPESSTLDQVHPFCNNANAAIRRNLWEVHAFDETLTGLEDLAWARWAKDQGYKISYIAEAEVVHIHHESPAGVYNRYRREAMAYKQIFPTEQFTFADFVNLSTNNILSDLQCAARQKCLIRKFIDILWFRLSQFWGTFQGYRRTGPLTEQLRRTFYYPHISAVQASSRDRDIQPIQYGED